MGGFIEVESRRRYQPLFRFPARGTVPRNSYSRRLKIEEIGRMSSSTGLIVFAVLYVNSVSARDRLKTKTKLSLKTAR